MRCRVCKVKITDEELGISEVVRYGLCVSCLNRFRIMHSFMRTEEDKQRKINERGMCLSEEIKIEINEKDEIQKGERIKTMTYKSIQNCQFL